MKFTVHSGGWPETQPVCPKCGSDATCVTFSVGVWMTGQFTRDGHLIVRTDFLEDDNYKLSANCDVCGWHEPDVEELGSPYHWLGDGFLRQVSADNHLNSVVDMSNAGL